MKKDIAIPNIKKEIANREELKAESQEIAKSLWSGKLTLNEQKALNHVCRMYDLDPLLKQIVILGGNVYITKGGLLNIANKREDSPEGIEVIPANEQERKDSRVPSESEYWKAIVWKKSCNKAFIEFGEASLGNVKLYKADWRVIQDMAKTRAVNRALRNAYNIGLTSLEEMGYNQGQVVNIPADVVPESHQTPVKGDLRQDNENIVVGDAQQEKMPEMGDPEVSSDKNITQAQQKRLFAIAKANGWSHDSLKEYLQISHNIEHTKDIPTKKYDGIISFLQASKT